MQDDVKEKRREEGRKDDSERGGDVKWGEVEEDWRTVLGKFEQSAVGKWSVSAIWWKGGGYSMYVCKLLLLLPAKIENRE